MKKLLSSFIALSVLLFSSTLWAPLNPIGMDTTTGQQKVSTNATIPDSGNLVDTGSVQTITGAKTFNDTKLLVGGAGAGVATLTNANTATSRTITIPDPGANSTLITLAGSQTITGAKTYSGADTLIVPTTSPSSGNGSLGFLNRLLHVFSSDASAVVDFTPIQFGPQGLYNICFIQGADSSQVKITSCQAGAALGGTNPGYVRIRSSTAGTYRTFTDTADVTLDLTGAHWGLDTQGDIGESGVILRIYAIDDNGTLKWGVGYCGGFYYIRNTQDDTTASNINLPEEIFVNSDVTTDNSPMKDVGFIKATFTDASNEWAISEYHSDESADGLWQPASTAITGFSATPSPVIRFTQIGKTVIYETTHSTGTSNATTFTWALPFKATTPAAGAVSSSTQRALDNSVAQTLPGRADLANASKVLTLLKDHTGAAWTNAGGKGVSFNLQYEAYQP